MKKVSTVFAALIVLGALTACTSASSAELQSPTPSAEENPYGGFAVDNPAADEIILTVKGPAETDEYSLNDLKKLAVKDIRIVEPFLQTKQTFTGVALSELFEAAGIEGSSTVSTIALNDYKFDDLASNFTKSKGLIAIARDGEVIPMDQGGPIRIVFPTDSDYFTYLDSWNWSLRTIEVAK